MDELYLMYSRGQISYAEFAERVREFNKGIARASDDDLFWDNFGIK